MLLLLLLFDVIRLFEEAKLVVEDEELDVEEADEDKVRWWC